MTTTDKMNPDASPLAETGTVHGGLTARDVEHREDFSRFVLNDAEPWHRDHLGRLLRLWEGWNVEYFGGRMVPPYIMFSPPSNPRALGDCSNISGFGGRSQIRIRRTILKGTHPMVREGPKFAEGRVLVVADILLHEMIHQWHQEITGIREPSYHEHGPAFRDECNRIGATLGLPPVRTAKARGKDRDLPSCSQWPHCVRPADYYRGALLTGGPDSIDDDKTDVPATGSTANPTMSWDMLVALTLPALVRLGNTTDRINLHVLYRSEGIDADAAEWLARACNLCLDVEADESVAETEKGPEQLRRVLTIFKPLDFMTILKAGMNFLAADACQIYNAAAPDEDEEDDE